MSPTTCTRSPILNRGTEKPRASSITPKPLRATTDASHVARLTAHTFSQGGESARSKLPDQSRDQGNVIFLQGRKRWSLKHWTILETVEELDFHLTVRGD